MEKKDKEDCIYMEMEGARPRKLWLEVVRNDMKELGLASVGALESGPSCLEEEDCRGYMLTQACLELSWDSSQEE